MLKEILTIDNQLTDYLNSLESQAAKLEFTPLGKEFKLNKKHIPEIPWHSFHYSGVYLFEIKNNTKFEDFSSWLNYFEPKWADPKYVASYTSNLKQKRTSQHKELRDWIPLYIGKSKSIEGRVHEHIFKELHKTTYALKLNARNNLFDETFRISTIKIDLLNYGALMPIIEASLRNKINPIIGKQ